MHYVIVTVYEIEDAAWEERAQALVAEYAEDARLAEAQGWEGPYMDRDLAEVVLSDADYWEDGEPGCRLREVPEPGLHFDRIVWKPEPQGC